MAYDHYTIETAMRTINGNIRLVQTGKLTMEQAVAEAVAETIREFASILGKVWNCCGCGYSEDAVEDLPEVAARLQKEHALIKV